MTNESNAKEWRIHGKAPQEFISAVSPPAVANEKPRIVEISGSRYAALGKEHKRILTLEDCHMKLDKMISDAKEFYYADFPDGTDNPYCNPPCANCFFCDIYLQYWTGLVAWCAKFDDVLFAFWASECLIVLQRAWDEKFPPPTK